MVKRLFFAILLIAMSVFSYAQDVKEVTLVVNGEGSTKEEATHVALRSAIEQAFGTFVSANTTILNDELVKDEIATISSGNIQKYTELGSYKLPNGNTSVSIEATVSIGKLVSYAKSKGSECEFAGVTFAANIKLLKLKYQNALIACNHLVNYIKTFAPEAFDLTIKVWDTPNTSSGEVVFDHETYIKYDTNANTRAFSNYVFSTLHSIGFSFGDVYTLWSSEENGRKKYRFEELGEPGLGILDDYIPYDTIPVLKVLHEYLKPKVSSNIGPISIKLYNNYDATYGSMLMLMRDFYRFSVKEPQTRNKLDEHWCFNYRDQTGLYYRGNKAWCLKNSRSLKERKKHSSSTEYMYKIKYAQVVEAFYQIPLPICEISFRIPIDDMSRITHFHASLK